jgi:hypothetical protein
MLIRLIVDMATNTFNKKYIVIDKDILFMEIMDVAGNFGEHENG